jgi:photosystem II stability/assembly factor-like uncharacterized protein
MQISRLLLLLSIIPFVHAVAQDNPPYREPDSPQDRLIFRDSEQWIKERYRWFYEQRAYPLGYIPDGVREAEWKRTRNMPLYKPQVYLAKESRMAATRWEQAGPVNIGGRITGIAVDPTNPDIVYFTAADGGVWKSENGTKLNAFFTPVADDLPTMAMGSIDIDPANPNLIYVGTGEANGSGDSYPGVGVVRSTDAGATWEVISNRFAQHIGCIRVSKAHSNILFAATRQGLFVSTDGGVDWSKKNPGIAHDLVQHPLQPEYVFAGVQGAGILRSSDEGVSWDTLDIGIGADSVGRIALDLCLTQPENMYAVIVGGKGPLKNKTFAVIRSTDAGQSWVRTTPAENPVNFFSTYGWYNCEIGVHPTRPDEVLIGGVSYYKSSDGGLTFERRGGMHVDQHAIEFSQTAPDIVYLGNDGGMYISGNGGTTYSSLNDNLPITQFYELGIAQQNPHVIIGGTQDNGSNQRYGNEDQWSHVSGGDGGYCVIDYTDTMYVYTEYQNGSHLRSTNGGRSFQSINEGLFGKGLWVTPVVIHPTEPTVLFTATTKQLYKTTDRGDLWFPFHGNMDSSKSVNRIAISPIDPDLMLVGYNNGKIWRSINGGVEWEEISEELPNRTCTDIMFHPTDIDTYFATFSGYAAATVYRTTDGGATWESISGDLPAIPTNAIEISPLDPNHMYVGTDFGVYATLNGGENWYVLGEGMPKVVVVDLELHHESGLLYAATHGRSTYRLTVTLPVEYTAFSAERQGTNVALHWRTSHETRNRGFGVERSTPDSEWEEIGFVPGRGSVAAVSSYDFTDSQVPALATTVYYRLKQVDLDGTVTYSRTIPVAWRDAAAVDFALEQNYPNPFNPVTNIRYALPQQSHVRITVTDATGRVLRVLRDRDERAGQYLVTLDASDLPSGAYFYHLEHDGGRITRKMLVLK